MKKAFGLLDLLFVIIIGIILFAICQPRAGRDNPFEEYKKTNSQKEAVNQKLQEIENTKKLKEQIEKNLKEQF